MASTSVTPRAAQPWYASLDADTVVRVLLAAAAVLLCYQFRWEWLRSLTAGLNLRLDALAGVHLQRISADTVLWRGETYQYVIACTFADVWCGALPLIWQLRRDVAPNLLRIAAFSLALLAFNIFRLSLSDVLFAAGLPWPLAHDVLGGVAYFFVWMWIWTHRTWAL